MSKNQQFREIVRSNTSISYINAGNAHAVIFLHGLGGNNIEYWGKLVELFNFDADLLRIDFYYWSYNSSKFYFAPPLFKLGSRERLSTVPELAAALTSEITVWTKRLGYQKVSVIGHSLGGFIALQATRYLLKAAFAPLKNVCLMGTPQGAHILAWLAAQLLQDLNPHLQFLAQEAQIQELLSSGLAETSSHGIRTAYIRCIGDALQAMFESQQFDEIIDLQGAHNWMSSIIDRNDARYSILKSYLLRSQ